jgi:hypothetical protein
MVWTNMDTRKYQRTQTHSNSKPINTELVL